MLLFLPSQHRPSSWEYQMERIKNPTMGANQVLVGSPRRGDLGRLGEPSLPPMEIAFSKPDLRPFPMRLFWRSFPLACPRENTAGKHGGEALRGNLAGKPGGETGIDTAAPRARENAEPGSAVRLPRPRTANRFFSKLKMSISALLPINADMLILSTQSVVSRQNFLGECNN